LPTYRRIIPVLPLCRKFGYIKQSSKTSTLMKPTSTKELLAALQATQEKLKTVLQEGNAKIKK
jgi:hypothetical protein